MGLNVAPLGLDLFCPVTQGCAILRADALRMAYPGLAYPGTFGAGATAPSVPALLHLRCRRHCTFGAGATFSQE
jgi:hypothetical protein